ncbi:MAG: hypothetical protein K6343_05455 [Caldisericaceae bacterium]
MKKLGEVLLFFCFLLIPSPVHADAGIKLTKESSLETLIVLILIIYVEALVYESILKVGIKNTLLPSAIANLVSMVSGIPTLLLVDIFLYSPLFRMLYKLFPSLFTPYYLGTIYNLIFSLIVTFFISVVIEYFIVKQFFKSVSTSKIKNAVWVGNIITYIILLVLSLKSIVFWILTSFL